LEKKKEVNDSMGHFEGDLVLARVGRLLEQKARQPTWSPAMAGMSSLF